MQYETLIITEPPSHLRLAIHGSVAIDFEFCKKLDRIFPRRSYAANA